MEDVEKAAAEVQEIENLDDVELGLPDESIVLLYARERTVGESGLYNALYQSDLTLVSAEIKDGTAIIALEGTLLLGGECDSPRVQAQLEMIPGQFPEVTTVEITINGKPLADVLSLK